MKIIELPLSQIKSTSLNPRKNNKGGRGFEELVANIKANGILQPPGVRKNGDGRHEIVWGNRRVEAARKLKLKSISVNVVEMDDINAHECALSENAVREDMDAIDQCVAFQKMLDNGRSVADIVERFGISASIINQRLKLGQLDQCIIDSYHAGILNIEQCMAFTLHTKEKQKEIIKGDHLQSWYIRNLALDTKINMEKALFKHSDYKGSIVMDLFSEDVEYFAEDYDEFMTLQRIECDKLRSKYLKDGWSFVEIQEQSFEDRFKGVHQILGKPVTKFYYDLDDDNNEYNDADKSECGVLIILYSDCSVVSSAGYKFSENEIVDTETGEIIEEKDQEDPTDFNKLTGPQSQAIAESAYLMFVKNATLVESIAYLLKWELDKDYSKIIKNNDAELLTKHIKNICARRFPKIGIDTAYSTLMKKNKWDLSKHFTPDERFIKGYSQPKLKALAKYLGVKLEDNSKKSTKVAMLVKAFKEGKGKAKSWLPKI
tara:strand:- start:412 stop:1875 length:1464 start_codon:yes stop_codon:yes gene_type:complete